MSDYKMEIQERAEQLAEDTYGMDFYKLSDALQYEVYCAAMGDWTDNMLAAADYRRKAEREL